MEPDDAEADPHRPILILSQGIVFFKYYNNICQPGIRYQRPVRLSYMISAGSMTGNAVSAESSLMK